MLSGSVLARAAWRSLVLRAGHAQRLTPPEPAALPGAEDLAAIARGAHGNVAAAARAREVPEILLLKRGPFGKLLQESWPTHARPRSSVPRNMAKIGRNDFCACGSGKKHKRCCLTAGSTTGVTTAPTAAPPTEPLCDCCIDQLEDRADHILDELLAGRLEHAEKLCQHFLRDFPSEAEGFDLLSMIYEEKGQRERALNLLRQASTIAHASPDYDAETRSMMRKRIKELEIGA